MNERLDSVVLADLALRPREVLETLRSAEVTVWHAADSSLGIFRIASIDPEVERQHVDWSRFQAQRENRVR